MAMYRGGSNAGAFARLLSGLRRMARDYSRKAIIAESLLAFARANWMDVIDLLHAWEYGGIAKNRAGGFQLFGSKPPAAMPSGF